MAETKESKEIESMSSRIESAKAYLHIDEISKELASLEKEMADANFWDNAAHAQEASKRASEIRELIDRT